MVDRGRDVSRDVLFAQTCFVLFFSPSERIEFFVVCFLYTSGQMFLSQTSSRRPPHIIGRRVTSVTLGWVGAPIERALLRFRDAIAVFADRCLTRIRMADQGLGGGVHEHCAGFVRAIKLRESCSGEIKNCPPERFLKLRSQGCRGVVKSPRHRTFSTFPRRILRGGYWKTLLAGPLSRASWQQRQVLA